MAKTKISEFSSTPGNNTDIDSINIAEGCAPSGINNAIRELMAQLKDFQTGAAGDSFNGPIGTSTAAAGAFTNLSASGTLGVTGVATLGNGAVLGTPASVTLTNATGLPISTGVSGLGTGVATALAVNVGSAGAPVVNGGALGTPSSGTVTNLTGTASININGTVGATTASTGAFTTLTTSGAVTHNAGTANGVAYLNGSKVLTTGSALTFDGTRLAVNVATAFDALQVGGVSSSGTTGINGEFRLRNTTANWVSSWNLKSAGLTTFDDYTGAQVWRISESEQMRLTSTGLGIGTSSPAARLDLNASGSNAQMAVQNWPMLRVIGTTLDIGGYNTSQWTQTRLYTNGSIAATLDSSGNLGLGVTPSANTIAKAFELQNGFNLFSAFNIGYINANAYFDGNWKYKNTAASGRYEITDSHKWFTAPSGTAGNAISFTQAMSLTADGNLAVGLTSTSFRVNATVQSGANRDVFAAQIAGASNGLTIKWNHATTTTRVNISNLPTSASGLASGDLWNDGGTLKIA